MIFSKSDGYKCQKVPTKSTSISKKYQKSIVFDKVVPVYQKIAKSTISGTKVPVVATLCMTT